VADYVAWGLAVALLFVSLVSEWERSLNLLCRLRRFRRLLCGDNVGSRIACLGWHLSGVVEYCPGLLLEGQDLDLRGLEGLDPLAFEFQVELHRHVHVRVYVLL
jgi:hypothetical protein